MRMCVMKEGTGDVAKVHRDECIEIITTTSALWLSVDQAERYTFEI